MAQVETVASRGAQNLTAVAVGEYLPRRVAVRFVLLFAGGLRSDRSHGDREAVPRELPASAAVRKPGIVLSSDHWPFTDCAGTSGAGVDPITQRIVVVKLGYLFPDLRKQGASPSWH